MYKMSMHEIVITHTSYQQNKDRPKCKIKVIWLQEKRITKTKFDSKSG